MNQTSHPRASRLRLHATSSIQHQVSIIQRLLRSVRSHIVPSGERHDSEGQRTAVRPSLRAEIEHSNTREACPKASHYIIAFVVSHCLLWATSL